MGPIIDCSTLFPYQILFLFATSIACYNILHSLLTNRFSAVWTFVAIFAARIISFLIADFSFPIYLLFLVITVFTMTCGKNSHKIIATILFTLSYIVSSLILSVFLIVIYQGMDYDEVFGTEHLDHLNVFLVECIFMVVVSYLFAGIARRVSSKKNIYNNHKIYSIITFFPLSHISCLLLMLYLAPVRTSADTPDFGLGVNIAVPVLLGIILLFDCCFPFAILYFENLEAENDKNIRVLLKYQMDYQQTAMLTEEKKEFRKIKHDFSNILTTVQGYIEIGKPEKALTVLQNTYTDLTGLAGFSVCGNETINTILYMKTQQAKECGVTLTTEINEECSVKIDDYDLCRLLANILDNALNAAALTDTAKFALIRIRITETDIHIHSENGFVQTVHKIKKSDIHGNGVGIIKEIAKNYSGNYKAYFERDIYYTDTVFENRILSKRKTSSYS